jgi:hypothetical protein
MADALATPARNSQQTQSTPAKPRTIVAAQDRNDVAVKIVKPEKEEISVNKFLKLLGTKPAKCPELDPIKASVDIVEYLNYLSGVVGKEESSK